MKNKIIATIAAFSLVGSAHAVDVNDNLSISGFIDGSYQSSEPSNAADTQQLGIDEVEIDFLFNVASFRVKYMSTTVLTEALTLTLNKHIFPMDLRTV
jgi:hypothetical protein